MAVRLFDLSEAQSTRLDSLQAAPRRQHARRTKQRYAVLGIVVTGVPFISALVVLGMSH
ncbi:MAG TPA: hypothetical protein VMF33_08400 [Acidimicrobiales bacterium]|nr:hypothetical protein [Acidimicrobiales bacterium]